MNEVHSAQNCANGASVGFLGGELMLCQSIQRWPFLFWRSTIHGVKFGQTQAAVTITAAENHFQQFLGRGSARMIFDK